MINTSGFGVPSNDATVLDVRKSRFFEALCVSALEKIGQQLSGSRTPIESQIAPVLENVQSLLATRQFERDLWQTLISVAVIKSEGPPFATLRRNLATTVLEANFDGDLNFVPSQPTPAIVDYFASVLTNGLESLEPVSQTIALSRLMGSSFGEIAESEGHRVEFVEKQIETIRRSWIRH